MYWRLVYTVGGVLALDEHVTVCPSSLNVDLPNARLQYTVAVTLTNSGQETAYLTLFANDTFNNPRERIWRASAKAARIVGDDMLANSVLRFENRGIDGHGVMVSHGDLEGHPDLEVLATAPPTIRSDGGRRRRYKPKGGPGREVHVDWHKVLIERNEKEMVDGCTLKNEGSRRHSELVCSSITERSLKCPGRAFWLKNGEYVELKFPDSCTNEELGEATVLWQDLLGSAGAEADELLEVSGGLRGRVLPDSNSQSFDPSWPNEWVYEYNEYAYPLKMIDGTTQWPLLSQYPISTSPSVMVIDTYTQLDHPDLIANFAINEVELNGIPGVDDDGDGVIDNIIGLDGTNMEQGDPTWSGAINHGTSVSGLIASRPNNDLGATGIAPQSRMIPCGCGNSTLSMMATADCMDWALDNAKRFNIRVINHSYTGTSYSNYVADLFAKGDDVGMFHTIATGNTLRDLDEVDPLTPLLYHAVDNLHTLIGVGRLDRQGNPGPSGYSRQWTHVYMPGELIVIIPPDGSNVAMGSGTSFAAPTMAGVIASMLTVNPELDVFDVLWILENSVIKDDRLTDLTKWGGFVNASKAIEYSHGTWIKPAASENKYVTLRPGESKTVDFTIVLEPDGHETATSRTAYISILGRNETRLSGVYKLGEVPVTVRLSQS